MMRKVWMMVAATMVGASVDPAALGKFIPAGTIPTCPAGGAYTLNPIGSKPTCRIAGHVLP